MKKYESWWLPKCHRRMRELVSLNGISSFCFNLFSCFQNFELRLKFIFEVSKIKLERGNRLNRIAWIVEIFTKKFLPYWAKNLGKIVGSHLLHTPTPTGTGCSDFLAILTYNSFKNSVSSRHSNARTNTSHERKINTRFMYLCLKLELESRSFLGGISCEYSN
jgi:hypothetical protein